MNRRGFLSLLPGLALGRAPEAPGALLRPPGARLEPEFLRRCIGCYRCAEVCPPACIRFDLPGGETPFIEARERACTLCMRCTEACPTGALEPIAALHAVVAERVRMGTPVLEQSACRAWNGLGLCRLCYYVCPYADGAIDLSGPRQAPRLDPARCVGCGLCEEACPTDARAIRIVPRGDR